MKYRPCSDALLWKSFIPGRRLINACGKFEQITPKTAVRRGNIFRSARLLFVLCVNYDLFGIRILMSTLRTVRMIHTKNRMTRIGIRQDVTIMTARASIR